jgi:hypothetical protein
MRVTILGIRIALLVRRRGVSRFLFPCKRPCGFQAVVVAWLGETEASGSFAVVGGNVATAGVFSLPDDNVEDEC